ncbi:hypothetical protein [Thermoflexibacter ruber]|uniref:Uncharacterized protein n=1 Tax=Thermoflexibacter ruber TaxID=1003 RepID=A0A1I2JSL7_9BACT|nr:hypothetical protein [Thermoflexibacter ruber]SFF57832.1 hypothetical protein SAMN04488541_106511 [Thermoflexibacter ruber]
MNLIKPKIWNRLVLNGDYIVAELKATEDNNRRWVAIYKNNGKPKINKNLPEYKYLILDFELDKSIIDTYFGEEDKKNQKRYYLNSEEEIYKKLNELNINPDLFDVPWASEYPL